MSKIMCVFHGSGDESHAGFVEKMLGMTGDLLHDHGHRYSGHLVVTADPPPRWSVIPFLKSKIAVISVYRNWTERMHALTSVDGFSSAYEVTEAIPVAGEINPEPGTPTPGACLLTLFRKRKDIDYTTFVNRWHNGHTPLSLRIHPLWNYNRNIVEKQLAGSGPWYDGIVEEQVRTRNDLLNPFRFFGPPLFIVPRMITVWKDVNGFIDYGSISTYLAQEYRFI